MAERRTVGVLGGLGPAATVDFLDKLVRATPAERDQDHVRVLLDMNPAVPCRHAAIGGRGPSAGPALAEMARGLEQSGADFLVMVCNTAHAFEPEIRAATRLPFVSIVEETVRAAMACRPALRVAGVLAAEGCLEAGLYERAFAARGVAVRTLDAAGRAAFMVLIGRIKAGRIDDEARSGMRELAERLTAAGAELLVAGCTEVPLVLAEADVPVPLLSSTDVLVERTLAYAQGEPLPA
ncbi:MAG TPA: amino acid racemase [Caulobacteraceae bacterium]